MRTFVAAVITAIGLTVANPSAYAVGCLSGGAAGALAGHMAHHAVLGALGGCIAGHAWHKHQLREQDYSNMQSYNEGRSRVDPNYQSPWQ